MSAGSKEARGRGSPQPPTLEQVSQTVSRLVWVMGSKLECLGIAARVPDQLFNSELVSWFITKLIMLDS